MAVRYQGRAGCYYDDDSPPGDTGKAPSEEFEDFDYDYTAQDQGQSREKIHTVTIVGELNDSQCRQAIGLPAHSSKILEYSVIERERDGNSQVYKFWNIQPCAGELLGVYFKNSEVIQAQDAASWLERQGLIGC